MSNGKPEEPTETDVLTKQEREAFAWALELMGDCNGADALRGMVARLSLIEAEAAAMREALRPFSALYRQVYRFRHQDRDDATVKVGELRAASEAYRSTTTGQAPLDRLKALEEENASLTRERAGLRDFLGVMSHEMEMFCDVNCTATDTQASISAALSMMHRWQELISAACSSARTALKEDAHG